MPAFLAPLAISGISALGGLFANRKQQQQQKQRTQSRQTSLNTGASTSNFLNTTNPVYDGPADDFRLDLIRSGREMLNAGDPSFAGYTANALGNVNQGAGIQQKLMDRTLASRGMSYSPIAAVMRNQNNSARIGEQNRVMNEIPLLREKMRQERLAAGGAAFSRVPHGTESRGDSFSSFSNTGVQDSDSTSEGTTQLPSNMAGGALGNLGPILAALFGMGAFGGGGGSAGAGSSFYDHFAPKS